MRTRPSRTASPAAFASGATPTNHCSDSRGSTTVSQREQCPTACMYGSLLGDDAALFAQRLHDGRTRLEAIEPLERPGHGDHAALVHDDQRGQAVALADLEVVRVVGRA